MARILVADDEPEIRSAIVSILKTAGHETCEAYDGLSALDYVKSFRPDAMLLDWMIPELFGGEVLEALRTNPEYAQFKNLPVIIVSDFDDDNSIRRFKEAGATDFVAKRDNPNAMKDLLLERIGKVL